MYLISSGDGVQIVNLYAEHFSGVYVNAKTNNLTPDTEHFSFNLSFTLNFSLFSCPISLLDIF